MLECCHVSPGLQCVCATSESSAGTLTTAACLRTNELAAKHLVSSRHMHTACMQRIAARVQAEGRADQVDLLRARDLEVGVGELLAPVRQVARHARHRKQHRKELRREPHRAVHQPCAGARRVQGLGNQGHPLLRAAARCYPLLPAATRCDSLLTGATRPYPLLPAATRYTRWAKLAHCIQQDCKGAPSYAHNHQLAPSSGAVHTYRLR